MIYFDIDKILDRAEKKALPRILKQIEKNEAKKKYLKRVRNRKKLKGD